MLLKFLDQNNNPLPATYPLSAPTGSNGKPMPVRFECREGYFLSAVVPAGVTAEARAVGDTEWINVTDSPIDLTPYAPDVQDFELRVTPDESGTSDATFFLNESPGQGIFNGNNVLIRNGNGRYILR